MFVVKIILSVALGVALMMMFSRGWPSGKG